MSSTATIIGTETESITAANILRLFPTEVNTSLVTPPDASVRQADELDGYDEEQVRLMEEVCIVLDENDNPIGSASKKTCMRSLDAHLV